MSDPKDAILSRYELVVGLEVHAQLSTKTKLFCGCALDFGAAKNSRVCPICLGMPGTMPALNGEALEKVLRLACALDAHTPPVVHLDRKNYFYPDLPKNYQISQNDRNLGNGGQLTLIRSGRSIGFDNVHIEEDAGKLLHPESGVAGSSLVDLNRAGTPLAEIVTKPDFRELDEIADYMETLRVLLLYLDICDGKMEEGSIRFEASVSVRLHGATELGKRSEIKNLNSMKATLLAVEFERARQIALLEAGGMPSQETRLWNDDFEATEPAHRQQWQDDMARPPLAARSEAVALDAVMALLPEGFRGRSRVMRSKEQAADYRYFPEPDLPAFAVSEDWKARLRAELPERPGEKRARYVELLGLTQYQAEILVAEKARADYFEELLSLGLEAGAAANWMLNRLLALLGDKDIPVDSIEDCPVRPADIAGLDKLVAEGIVTQDLANKSVFNKIVEARLAGQSLSVLEIVERGGFKAERDEDKIKDIIAAAIAKNPKAIADLQKGKQKARGALMGFVMRETRGKAPPKLVNALLDAALRDRLG